MGVQRWVLHNPYDSSTATNTYTFPRNPTEMTSPYVDLPITTAATTNGRLIAYEGNAQAKQWTFKGYIFTKQELLDLHAWVYDRKVRLQLTDHYSRVLTVVLTGLDVVPVRRVNVYYSHDYTVTALVLGITAPSVADTGPVG